MFDYNVRSAEAYMDRQDAQQSEMDEWITRRSDELQDLMKYFPTVVDEPWATPESYGKPTVQYDFVNWLLNRVDTDINQLLSNYWFGPPDVDLKLRLMEKYALERAEWEWDNR
jgi:hypothetical protein